MQTHNLPSRVTGKDGKAYPAQRVKPKTEAAPGGAEPPPQELKPPPAGSKYEAIASMLKAGKPHKVIARELHVDNKRVGRIARELGIIRQTTPKANGNGSADRSRAAVQERTERIRELAAEGYNVPTTSSSWTTARPTIRPRGSRPRNSA